MRNLPNFYCSFSPGMPIVNGVPGSLVEMLKALLTNGTTPVSFPSIKVENGLATVVALSPWSVFFNGSTINITGCAEPLLNGPFVIKSHNTNNFQFETTAADGTYGGDIKINQQGAGWIILYTGTNTAVFISGNLDTLGYCIKVTDVNAYYATVEFYESMTSLTEGVNKFNNTIFRADKTFFINKSTLANATAQHYWLIADNTSCHFTIDRTTAANTNFISFFGNLIISFGQCESFDKNFKKNFYFNNPPSWNNLTVGNYDGNNNYYSYLGINNRFGIKDYYDSSNGIFINNNAYTSYKPLKIRAVDPLLDNGTYVTSGSIRNASFKMNMSSFLVSPYIFYTSDFANNGSSQPVGYLKECLFYKTFLLNYVDKMSIETINGKKYINLPIFFSSGARAITTINYSDWGIVPFLIGEKWGD